MPSTPSAEATVPTARLSGSKPMKMTLRRNVESEPYGCAHDRFHELLRKEHDEPQANAKEDERDQDVHGGFLQTSGVIFRGWFS